MWTCLHSPQRLKKWNTAVCCFFFQFSSELHFPCHQTIECCHLKVCSRASCSWIWGCCSHNGPFCTWLSAIFPSLHRGPNNPKTNMTTTQACGSSLFSTLPHPKRSDEALCGVMSWGTFHYQSSLWTCEIYATSGREEQLTIMNYHCAPQPTLHSL